MARRRRRRNLRWPQVSWRRVARNVAFALVATVLFFGIVEGALRALGIPPVATGAAVHNELYWVEEPNQRAVPRSHKEVNGSFRVSTDALGLRLNGGPRQEAPFTIMAMGCSTTFGWGVEDAEAWPAKLENHIRAAGGAVRVVNAGQPGYSTLQGLWLWDRVGGQVDPDLVILGFVVQDARKVPTSDTDQALSARDAFFLREQVLYRLNLYRWMLRERNEALLRRQDRAGPEGVYRVAPADYAANLSRLAGRARASGAEVVYFGYPLEVEGYTELHRQVLREQAARDGAPWFDPSARVTEEARRRQLYFPQDRGHANAAGNDTIAQLVLQFLDAEGLLP